MSESADVRTVNCREGRHATCKPWGQPADANCDCYCHEESD